MYSLDALLNKSIGTRFETRICMEKKTFVVYDKGVQYIKGTITPKLSLCISGSDEEIYQERLRNLVSDEPLITKLLPKGEKFSLLELMHKGVRLTSGVKYVKATHSSHLGTTILQRTEDGMYLVMNSDVSATFKKE